MAATEKLHPEQFKLYHSGPHWFSEGDTVNPTHGVGPVAYAAKDPNNAAFFGIAKSQREPPGGQLPLFVPVYEVSSPDAKPAKNDTTGRDRFMTSKKGFRVDKLHGYVRSAVDYDQPSEMRERWL